MMNELVELNRHLEQSGVTIPMQHVNVSKAARDEKKLIVLIDRDGCPVFYYLAESSTFFRHSKRNHHSFPVIRIKQSLCSPDRIPENVGEPAALSESFPLNEESGDIVISEWTKGQLEKLCQENEQLQSLGALIERFPDTKEKTKRFNRSLVDLIQEDIAYRPELQTIVREIFFGKKPKSPNQKWQKPNTQIVFDLAEAFPTSLPVQHPELWNMLQRLLREQDRMAEEEGPPDNRGISYLSGQESILEREKTPDPTLPVLGGTFIYTRNSNMKYLKRFGLNGLDFHMGRQEIQKVVDALVYLTQEELKGRIWSAFPSQKKSPNLLIAYVEQNPLDGFAELLGGSQELYAEVVARVTEQFRERYETTKEQIPPRIPRYTIRLLILGKIDDARKQILLNRQYNMEQVIDCAQRWQKHFESGPQVDLPNGKSCGPLYPMDLAELTQNVWGLRNGKIQKIAQLPPIKLGDLYDLYIPPAELYGYQELCHRLLDRFVTQGWDLIRCVGHAICRGEIKDGRKKDENLRCALRFFGVYTMLLDKINSLGRENMKSIAFLLGQFLKAVDILHKEYCRVNSPKNPLPPRLLGNAHYQIAFDRPLDAIELVSQRLPVYIAWADTAQDKAEGAHLAKRQLEEIMGQELFVKDAFADWGSVQRAQMMQGYLAKLPEVKQVESLKEEKKEG